MAIELQIGITSQSKIAWAETFQNGMEVDGKDFEKVKKAASKNKIYVITGLNEVIKKGRGNGTIYNSACIINGNG